MHWENCEESCILEKSLSEGDLFFTPDNDDNKMYVSRRYLDLLGNSEKLI